MKRFIASSLLLGYIMLVPFCFFGGALMGNSEVMNMIGNSAHEMSDCGMPVSGCMHGADRAGGMDAIAHHFAMYLSISQTPLVALSILLATFLILTFTLVREWLSVFSAQALLRQRIRRRDEPHGHTQQQILAWLSLFETSPNFA